MRIFIWFSRLPSFEKCNVKYGRVEIDELEQVHFDGERVLVFAIGLMILWNEGIEVTRMTLEWLGKKTLPILVSFTAIHE